MRNLLNFGFVVLILIVLGCNCGDRLKEMSKKGEQNPPPAKTEPSNSSTTAPARGDYILTIAKYEQVKTGMKRGDVENIFGGKGTEIFNRKGSDYSLASVKWLDEKSKMVIVNFENDKVIKKIQVGLKK